MKITYDECLKKFDAILEEEISRQEASDWASEQLQAFGTGALQFVPETAEKEIIAFVHYLNEVDDVDEVGEYQKSRQDIIDFLLKYLEV